jgi:thioredoxin 1
MSTVHATKENFNDLIEKNGIVMIDFWAEWCGPCKRFAPIFEEVSEKHSDVLFAKVDTEEQTELAGAFGIRSIPTLMVFRDQVLLFEQAGALPGQALEEILTQVRALDMVKIKAEIAAAEAAEAAGKVDGSP